MLLRNAALLSLTLFVAAATVSAQDASRQDDGQYIPAPGAVERFKRNQEILQRAESFTLTLTHVPRETTDDDYNKDVSAYPAGGKFIFRLEITSTSVEPVEMRSTDYLDQDRPQLTKDGMLVPYRLYFPAF